MHKKWIPESALNGETMSMRCFRGRYEEAPLADLTLEVDGRTIEMEVVVEEDLGCDALIGRDAPFLWELKKKLAPAGDV